jgi:DNA polymerase III alpha subunit
MSAAVSYAELQVTTHFSFLRGASSPEELFATAALLGISAVGVVDHGSLAGIVRAHEAAKATGVRLIVGAWLDPTDGPPLLVYPTDRTAYGRLCRLLTLGKVRAGKGGCELTLEDVGAWSGGLLAILLSDDPNHAQLATDLRRLRSVFGDRLYPTVWLLRLKRTDPMPIKRHKPEEIVAKLRQVDVLVSQGQSVADSVRSIGVTEVSAGRTPERRDLLHTEGGADRDRELATALQLSPAARLARLQAAGA